MKPAAPDAEASKTAIPASSTASDASEPRRAGSLTVGSVRRLTTVYALAAFVGACFGGQGLVPWNSSVALTPAARVGYALQHELSPDSVPGWAQLASDVASVRTSRPLLNRPLFNLVVAARGLEHQGKPQRDSVQHECEALNFVRCDGAALEILQQRSRP